MVICSNFRCTQSNPAFFCTDEQAVTIIQALKTYFIGCFEREELTAEPERLEAAAPAAAPAAVYSAWLRRQYASAIAALLAIISSDADPRVQVSALSALMEFVRGRKAGVLDNEVFAKVATAALTREGVAPEVLGALIEKFTAHADVRYHFLRTISRVCDHRASRPALTQPSPDAGSDSEAEEGKADGGSDGFLPTGELTPHDLARTVLDVLLRLPDPSSDMSGDGDITSWCGAAEVGIATAAADANGSRERKKRRKVEREADLDMPAPGARVVAKWASSKLRRRAYSDAWMSFLRLDLPDDAYRKALSRLHDLVIPNLVDPLLLSDFLTHSLDKGGLVGMLALNGIFLLVTGHGLEYPRFYERLYGLLTPDAFLSRHRLKFFQLADVFLASGLVPAYTCAAFAKRLARLALTAPPGGALVAIAFIHNILRRHPACLQMIHRSPKGDVAGAALTTTPSAPGADAGPVWRGEDVYVAREVDPAKSRALESSLWELTALRRHADPSVANYCAVLDKDVSDRRKTAEVDVSEALGASYTALFTREVERRLKQVPAAFYPSLPKGLFAEGGDGTVADFAGWRV